MSQQGKRKTTVKACWTSIFIAKKRKFSCVLYAHFSILAIRVRKRIQPHTYARLFVYAKALTQPDFTAVNCSDAVMSVFYFTPLF